MKKPLLMNRRLFVQKTFLTTAGYIALGGGLMSIASCKKEEVQVDLIQAIKQQLSERIRKREDSFSFFYSLEVIKPASITTAQRNRNGFLRAFHRSEYVITTNFNPFDDVFDSLQIVTIDQNSNRARVSLKLPQYPRYNFIIKKTKIRSAINVPKKCGDFYVVDQEFINQFLNKYKVNI